MQVRERPQHETRDLSGALSPELHLRAADLERIAEDLVAYHARFARAEQRAWAGGVPAGAARGRRATQERGSRGLMAVGGRGRGGSPPRSRSTAHVGTCRTRL